MWLAKLQRMMNELPEKYLKPYPCDMQSMAMLPPDARPVSQITEEEKRLYGVANQLMDKIDLDDNAHEDLSGRRHKINESCLEHSIKQTIAEDEVSVVRSLLNRSVRERLGSEKDYLIDGYDVYAVPCLTFERMRQGFEISKKMQKVGNDTKSVVGFDGIHHNWPTTKH